MFKIIWAAKDRLHVLGGKETELSGYKRRTNTGGTGGGMNTFKIIKKPRLCSE